MLLDPIRVTLLVTQALEQLKVPYLIGGSLASAVHGVVRATMDADIVADLKPEDADRLEKLLLGKFYIDSQMIVDAIRYRSSFNLIHLETMFKVDIFIAKQRPFDCNQLQRRKLEIAVEGQDQTMYVTTAEDIILAKLEWFKLGGEISERQWRDVLGVMGVKANELDLDYLGRWARDLRISELLERALQESGLV